MDQLILDFPSQPACECKPKNLAKGLRGQPKTVLKGRDYLGVFEREDDVSAINPDFEVLKELDSQGVIVTAAGDGWDFASRYFAPAAGIPEDPVTGSTHCALIPYWVETIGEGRAARATNFEAWWRTVLPGSWDRVGIGGNAVTYLQGLTCRPCRGRRCLPWKLSAPRTGWRKLPKTSNAAGQKGN
jgi:predicted PhzF superfamily epimerase YddE/YHI9